MRQTVDKLKKTYLKRQSVDNDVRLENFVGRGKVLTMVGFKTFEKNTHTRGSLVSQLGDVGDCRRLGSSDLGWFWNGFWATTSEQHFNQHTEKWI